MTPLPFIAPALAVIDSAFTKGAKRMAPLFSGGHDSLSATYLASMHPRFEGVVYHIVTGIGCRKTFEFVKDTANSYGWTLKVLKSPDTYEAFIRSRGFPGPGMHQWAYVRLKDRCIYQITKANAQRTALITGCRSQESVRRMGHVEPLKIGEPSKNKKTGKVTMRNLRRYWVAPCHDWTAEHQAAFMEHYDLPRNPIKETPIGMSGECFCGAFARPNEIELLRRYVPDVASEIDRLAQIAQKLGHHAVWGTRPDGKKGLVVAPTGPLCNSCDTRAMAAGIVIDGRTC